MGYIAQNIIKLFIVLSLITALLVGAMSNAGIEAESIKAFFHTF